MPGLVIPSILDQQMAATRLTLGKINDRGKWGERGIHRLGNGMMVTQSGEVVVEPRQTPPTQGESEDMQAMAGKFLDWMR